MSVSIYLYVAMLARNCCLSLDLVPPPTCKVVSYLLSWLVTRQLTIVTCIPFCVIYNKVKTTKTSNSLNGPRVIPTEQDGQILQHFQMLKLLSWFFYFPFKICIFIPSLKDILVLVNPVLFKGDFDLVTEEFYLGGKVAIRVYNCFCIISYVSDLFKVTYKL